MDLERVPKFGCLLGVLIHQILKIRPRYSPHRRRLCLGYSVGMAVLQQFEQPALRNVAGHFPRPDRRRPSVARDLSESVSPGTVAFDRDHLDAFTAIGIIGGKEARSFTHPCFAGEHVSVHPPTTKAISQHRVYRRPCSTMRPTRRNVENLAVGHTLKSRMDHSGALEFGADTAQRGIEVLVERGGIQSRQVFPIGGCCFSALATVAHYLITSTTLIFAGSRSARIARSAPTRPFRSRGCFASCSARPAHRDNVDRGTFSWLVSYGPRCQRPSSAGSACALWALAWPPAQPQGMARWEPGAREAP